MQAESKRTIWLLGILLCCIPLAVSIQTAFTPSGYCQLDSALLAAAASMRCQPASAAAEFFSFLGRWYVIAAAAAVLAASMYRCGRFRAMAGVIAAVCGAGASCALIKVFIMRPRPGLEFTPLIKEPYFSFPSGHASSSSAVLAAAAILALQSSLPLRHKILTVSFCVLLDACIIWSRIYFAVHYPTDVCAGASLGILWAWLFCADNGTKKNPLHAVTDTKRI